MRGWLLPLLAALSLAAGAAPGRGDRLPPLQGADQFGHPQTLDSLAGPQGLILVVFRSADW